MTRIPILCYHSQIIAGNDYRHNGHRALALDLQLITELGFDIVPLSQVAAWHQEADAPAGEQQHTGPRQVAITFDDGMCSDFAPVSHPEYGELPGFLPILEAFRHGPWGARQPHLHATAFVIASDRARHDIDQQCHNGIGWDHNRHWSRAVRHPLLALENHSWDHNHEACGEAPGRPTGTFRSIDNFALCEHEIRRASQHLELNYGYRPRFFAYPYGDHNAYVSGDYLPSHGPAMGLQAAFTTAGEYATRHHSRWLLPRFVHGYHWRTPAALQALLRAA